MDSRKSNAVAAEGLQDCFVSKQRGVSLYFAGIQ